jgi:hypothetical protein
MLPPATPKPRTIRQISVHSANHRLTNELQNARRPAKALSAPVISRKASGKSALIALHASGVEAIYFPANHILTGQKRNAFIACISETAMDTAERLGSQRNLNTKGVRTLARPSLLGPIEEQSETSSIRSSRIQSALDKDGDSVTEGDEESEEESEDDS